jgi:hypothetical protein
VYLFINNLAIRHKENKMNLINRIKVIGAVSSLVLITGLVFRLTTLQPEGLRTGQCLLSTTNGVRMKVEARNAQAYFLEIYPAFKDIELGDVEASAVDHLRARISELEVFIASGHLVKKSCLELEIDGQFSSDVL